MSLREMLRAPLIGLALVGTLGAAGISGCASTPAPSSSQASTAASYQQVSAQEAADLMASESGYVIVDVRTQEEFAEGHIPDAVCIPVETIGSEDPAELADHEQLILVYCRSGNRSKQASQKLAELGYSNVVEFGGIRDWPGEVVTD